MDKSRWGVHETHCCVLHGCKYGDDDCPVANRQTKQEYPCETCGMWEGITEIPDPDHPDYDLLEMGDIELREEATKLRKAIRQHRDEKGHDRCQVDDKTLYAALPEGIEADLTLPPVDEFIPGCIQYWLNRQEPVVQTCDKLLTREEIASQPEAVELLQNLRKLVASLGVK